MRLIAILFLCSRLLPGGTQELLSQEIDCNDEDVFKAVDAALNKYNDRNKSGNQFVLHRVTEVTKTVGTDIFYSLEYQIKEGDCPVQSGKTWQDCNYRDALEAATGECTATVGKRSNGKFSVATQTCQITPAEGPVVTAQYNCLGCVHPVSTKSPDLEPILSHAVQHFNNRTDHSYLFALKEVKGAQRQVVAGWNFQITYTIAQTNCSKENFLFLTPDCKSLLNGDIGECRDNAYVDPQLRIASFSQNCELFPGEDFVQPPTKICAGCPREIPVDSPMLKEVLTHSMAKLNAENNETFFFKIDTVKRATVQVVAGQKFAIEFTARETSCSKESNEELTESCEIKSPGQSLHCNADIYVIPWEKKIYPTVKCQSLGMVGFFFSNRFILFIWKAVIETKTNRERELYLLVHSLNGYKGQGWVSLKPGTRISTKVSHMGGRHPRTWSSSAPFLGTLIGSWIGSRAARTQTSGPIWNAGVAAGSLTRLITTLTLNGILITVSLMFNSLQSE